MLGLAPFAELPVSAGPEEWLPNPETDEAS